MGKTDNIVAYLGLLALLAGLSVSGGRAEGVPSESPAVMDELLVSPTKETELATAVLAVETYEDEYLFGADATADELYFEEERALPGRRFFATEFVYYNNDSDFLGDQTEQGLRMRWRRETLNFGELTAEISLSSIDRNFVGSEGSSTEAMMTFRQQGAPLNDAWTMNNTVGYQRTLTGDMLDGGYRVRLPNSPLLGVTGEFVAFDKSAQWFTGKTGRIIGVALNQFERDGGGLYGAAYQQDVSDSFSFGSQVVNFSGNEFTRAHTSLFGSVRFTDPDRLSQYDISLLADDDANFGLWADGEQILRGDFLVRYGAFYLDPELAWMDKPISNDQLGYYARADKQTYSYNLSAGYDFHEFGLNQDDGSRTTSHNFYFNGNYRFTRNLNLGLAATVISREVFSVQDDDQFIWRLNNFAFYRSLIGTSRFELYANQVEADLGSSQSDLLGFLVSQEWRMPQSMRLTTELRLEDSTTASIDTSRREINVLFRHEFMDQLSWGANVSSFQNTDRLAGSYDGIGLNADMRWEFMPNWYASLNWIHNATTFGAPSVAAPSGGEVERTGNTFWLTLGYAKTSGQVFQNLGVSNGGVGSGRVEGEVFLDENNDFIRQPGERPVVGAVVLLDGRYEARTDSRGRYSFEPVYTGPHRVSLDVSELPLPWGLWDEMPLMVNVGLRRPGEANFALTQID